MVHAVLNIKLYKKETMLLRTLDSTLNSFLRKKMGVSKITDYSGRGRYMKMFSVRPGSLTRWKH